MATPIKQSRLEESSIESSLSDKLPVKWTRGPLIGEGAFGNVYLVVAQTENDKETFETECETDISLQEYFVVKDIPIKETDKAEIKERLKIETTILTSLEHPHIVQYFGYYQTDNIFSIFLRYMKMGSLYDYIQKQGAITESKIQLYTRQILEAVAFLHDNNIIHRDIKGKNILLEDEDNIRLTDFGISKILKDVTSTGTACIGTYRWMAPEVATADGSTQKYNMKADIWSVGCTVVEMITGKLPYYDTIEDHAVLFKIGQHKEPPQYTKVSKDCDEFLKKTFNVNPLERPAAKELLEKDIFINFGQKACRPTATTIDRHQLLKSDTFKTWRHCRKNEGHKHFIPAKSFAITDLPLAYQSNELFELIKTISELTVCVTVKSVSYKRPQCTDNGIPYPYYRERGRNLLHTASGMLDLENNTPENVGFTFNVVTAKHVVFDNSEAVETECRLFYDDNSPGGEIIYGLEVVSADSNTDRCVMKCICHDMNLLEHLKTTWERYKDLNRLVTGRYKHQRDDHRLCVVVSHPHGATKHVTIGEWIKRESCGMVPMLNIPLTKYYYTTATCPGSAGAPVFILGSGTGMYHHTHSGSQANVNCNWSGMFFD